MATISLPDQLIRTRRFTLGDPEQVTVTPDGHTVLFLRSRAGDDPVTCLWALDPESGTEQLLAEGIDGYAAAGGLIVCTSAGELSTVRPGEVRRLPTAGQVTDPRPDPSGTRIAYVCDDTLRVIDADGTGDRAIAEPDGPDVTFGAAELTGSAGLGGEHGYWWSPDGDRLLVARVDSTHVPLWYTTDPAEPGQRPRGSRYAAVGQPGPDVSLWLVDLAGSRIEARWDALPYLRGCGLGRARPVRRRAVA